ncbi:MAG: hypothetical protein PHV03_09300, partial [Desulfitobacteriaceae bacterium]|nr:hypothetical protein [Desulfitobacteriaceae bacterium]
MLDEFENIVATDSVDNIELFAAEVIGTIEKEAAAPLLGAVLRPVGKGIVGAGKKVFGGLHKAQMNLIKDTVKSPTGLALTGGAVALAGPTAVAEGMFPMIGATKQAVGQVSADLKTYNKLADDEISELIEKIALDTDNIFNNDSIETKDIINTVGASLVGGGLGYAAASKGFNFLDNASITSDIGAGTQKTISNIGKGTARAFTKNRPGTNIAASVLANTGKFADTLGGRGKKLRTDFSTLTGKPSTAQTMKSLGKFLGILAGASLAEEYFANWARNKIDEAVVDYKVDRMEDKTAATVEPEKEPPVPKKDLKRLLHDRSVKPVLTTGTFLFTLGGLSALTGRNLYGGMERVEKDEYRPANRVIIDISDPDAAKKYYERRPELVKGAVTDDVTNLIDKVADVGGVIDMDRLNEESKKNVGAPKEDWVPETKLDKMKAKIDEKAKNAPKPIRKFDEFLANADKYKYSGRTGLGHWLLEELPFKSVESLAYAAPMIATAVLLNRNAKRGFAPLQSDPNTPYVPEGMTRVIIQESGYKDKDGNVV